MDRVSKKARSRIMSAVGRENTGPEVAMREALEAAGLACVPCPGWASCRADLWLASGVAVLVDGCFWHQCPVHGKGPENASRPEWREKLEENVQRDRRNEVELLAQGVLPVRVWECDVMSAAETVASDVVLAEVAMRSGAGLAGLAYRAGRYGAAVDAGRSWFSVDRSVRWFKSLWTGTLRAAAELYLLDDLTGAWSVVNKSPTPSGEAALRLYRADLSAEVRETGRLFV